jgi:hypothetical protein
LKTLRRTRKASREALGLTKAEFAVLRRLDTPQKIQAFLNGLQQNFELKGETCNSVRTVLKERRAHCIEGAILAAAALWIQGEPPLLLDLQAVRDFDHVVAVFRRNGRWGAISKTNGIGLRWRDPVYRTLRELAMSWLHEYYNKRDQKTLRTYSLPYDLRRFPPGKWVTPAKGAWDLVDELEATRHFDLMSKRQVRSLVRRDPFERKVGSLLQYRRPKKKTAGGRKKKG